MENYPTYHCSMGKRGEHPLVDLEWGEEGHMWKGEQGACGGQVGMCVRGLGQKEKRGGDKKLTLIFLSHLSLHIFLKS